MPEPQEWTPEVEEWTPDKPKELPSPPTFGSEFGKLTKFATTPLMPDAEEAIGNAVGKVPYAGPALKGISNFLIGGATSPLGLATLGAAPFLGHALGSVGEAAVNAGKAELPEFMNTARATEMARPNVIPQNRKLLPLNAGPSSIPRPGFISGEGGTAINKLHPYDLNAPFPNFSSEGTIMPQEVNQLNMIPPELLANKTVPPNLPQPTLTPEEIKALPSFPERTPTGEVSGKPFLGTGQPTGSGDLPSATKLKRPSNMILDEAGRPIALKVNTNPISQAGPNPEFNQGGTPNPEYNIPEPPRTIHPAMAPHQAIRQWANKHDAAGQWGQLAQQEFKELDDPNLVNVFQAGNRQGKLKDVQLFLDNLFAKEKSAGLLDDKAYKENYLRQYWDWDKSSPEAKTEYLKATEGIAANKKTGIGTVPSFTKDSTFNTYQQGINAGMIPKYTTIPEIIGARVAEDRRALANKELYDYLKSTDRLKEGATPGNFLQGKNLIGADKEELQRYITNYLSTDRPLGMLGKAGSLAKNIYLSGGVPYTKYQMHAYNIAKSDIGLAGFGPGIKELLTDPTGNKAMQWFNDLESSRKELLPKLMEHGYQFHPMSDLGAVQNNPLMQKIPGKTGEIASKTLQKVEDIFEAPGFARAFPVLKFKRAEQIYDKLIKSGMDESSALEHTAQIANENFGGIEKSVLSSTTKNLQNKTVNDLSRFALMAPDWMESKISQAVNDWKAAGKVVTGKGNAADKIRATSLLRRSSIPAAGAVLSGAAYGSPIGKSQRETAAIPLGDKAFYPTMGTSDESVRPLAIAGDVIQNKKLLAPLKTEIGNRISPLLKAPYNIAVTGRDDLGRPLENPRSALKTIGNTVGEATRPLQPQQIAALRALLAGKISLQEAVAQGLELPIGFKK